MKKQNDDDDDQNKNIKNQEDFSQCVCRNRTPVNCK